MNKYTRHITGGVDLEAADSRTDETPLTPASPPPNSSQPRNRRLLHRSHGAGGGGGPSQPSDPAPTDTTASPAEDGAAESLTAQRKEGVDRPKKDVARTKVVDEDGDVIIDDDEEDEGNFGDDDADVEPGATSSGESGATPHKLYTCDVCPHAIFTTAAALHQHAVEQHSDMFPDYTALRAVAQKLVPVWELMCTRRRVAIQGWGRKVFSVALRRDAGPLKMKEAHRAREQLEVVIRRWHPTARVYTFGSSVTFAVWDGISDIDFTVVDVEEMEAGTWPPPEKNAVRSITELLRRAGFSFVNLEPISHARVPIIKHHASSPISVGDEPLLSHLRSSSHGTSGDDGARRSQREAENVIARSVRYTLSGGPATWEDRVMLEGSVREAVGAHTVQQVWWNRTGEMMSLTLDTTTSAMAAATCALSFVTPSLRARVQPLHDECRPELYNTDFDLSFRAFGIRNSLLLRRYMLSHPCTRPGAIVLKDWSKSSGINNSINGYLTSYAINIMWIYFLIQKGVVPYVDPIEDIPASLRGNHHYDPDYVPFVDPAWPPERLEALYDEMGSLLIEFFHFYAFEFNWVDHVVSLSRCGVTTKRMLGWDCEDIGNPAAVPAGNGGGGGPGHGVRRGGATRYSFCVEDPYEENLNLGRHMGITKTLRVHTEFYRGMLSLLKDKETESCVFASTDAADAAGSRDAAATSLLSGDLRRPTQLPLKVLYRLMAVTMQELAAAAREQPATSVGPAGVPEAQLEAAFQERAGTEYQLARKAWNWQQLIHRLGYKVNRGTVYARREIGLRRVPDRGVVPSRPNDEHAATEMGVGESAETTATTADDGTSVTTPHLSSLRSRGFTEQMIIALSEGFMRLTPEWVAWSRPWATLHTRGYAFFTPSAITDTQSGALPPPPAAAAATTTGIFKSTRRGSMWWRPMEGSGVSGGQPRHLGVRALVRGLLHR